ncbi:MAG: potassium channel protein [Verrucomicrobiota bacterium]
MNSSIRLICFGGALFVISFLLGEIAYSGLDDWNFIDILYMVIITAFGVGYGEVHPIETTELKLWTILIIVTGCTSLILVTGGIVQLLLESKINQLMGKKMTANIDQMKNHVIVVGYGRVGHVLVHELLTAGKEVVIVDVEDLCSTLNQKEIGFIQGDATDETILQKAGVERASTIAIVLPNDALNVFITLSARNLNPEIDIIARGEAITTKKKLSQAGANRIVMPTQSGAEHIAQMITRPAASNFLESRKEAKALIGDLEDLGLELEEIEVESFQIGKTLKACEKLSENRYLIVAIHRGNEVISQPELDTVIEKGDSLLVIAHLNEQGVIHS